MDMPNKKAILFIDFPCVLHSLQFLVSGNVFLICIMYLKREVSLLMLTHHFPVRLQAFLFIKDVIDSPAIALRGDFAPLLAGTMVLACREHQVLFSPLFILHHSVREMLNDCVFTVKA